METNNRITVKSEECRAFVGYIGTEGANLDDKFWSMVFAASSIT